MQNLKLKKFEIKSLAIAVYTICAWPSNRRYVGITDQLNRLFLAYEQKQNYGNKRIDSYQDFVRFFNTVKNVYSGLPREDLNPDIGQVKFYSIQERKYFSIFVGNGSEDVFESCYLADRLVADDSKNNKIWQKILDYEDSLLKTIYFVESPINSEFTCPSKEFFEQIKKYYDNFFCSELANYFRNYRSINDELYSFFSVKYNFPIFLPVMKEVFEERLELEKSTEDLEEAAKYVLRERLADNFSNNCNSAPNYLFNASVCNADGNKIVSNVVALFYNNQCVVVVPSANSRNINKTINAELPSEKILIRGQPSVGVNGHITVPSSNMIKFQFVNVVNLSPNQTTYHFGDKSTSVDISIKDLIGILNYSRDIQSIIEFLDTFLLENRSDTPMYLASGYSGLFQIWEKMDHVISESGNPISVFGQAYLQANTNIEFFTLLQKGFPYNAGTEFKNPFYWHIRNKDDGSNYHANLSLISKGQDLDINIYSDRYKSLIYCESITLLDSIQEDMRAAIPTFTEILDSGLKRHTEDILACTNKTYLKIIITSNQILQRYGKASFKSKYSKMAVVNEGDMQTVFIVPDWEFIFHDSAEQHTRIFENGLLEDVLQGFDLDSSEKLKSILHADDSKKRTSEAASISVDYFIDPNGRFLAPSDTAFKKARQIIAKVVQDEQIAPGTYQDYEALSPIKKFRNRLREKLIQIVNNYDKRLLMMQLLNIHARILLQIQIYKESLEHFSGKGDLEESAEEEFRKKTINRREESRQYQSVLEYLIETAVIHGNAKGSVFSEENLQILVALAKWIIDFQFLADQVNFGAVNWMSVDIQDDGVVDLKPTESTEIITTEIMQAKYDFGDYGVRNQVVDKKYYQEFKNTFYEDTKLDFSLITDVLYFLYENGSVKEMIENNTIHAFSNVVEADVDLLAKKFKENSCETTEQFYKALQFITLTTENLIGPLSIK